MRIACSECGKEISQGFNVCEKCCVKCSENNEITYNKLSAGYYKLHSRLKDVVLSCKSEIEKLEEENKKLKEELATLNMNSNIKNS